MENDSTTTPAATTDTPAATTPASSQSTPAPVVQSSREMAQQGATDTTDWKAKYDGLVGTYRARTNELNTEIDRQKLLVQERDTKIVSLEAKITELTTQLTAANAFKDQVTTLTAEKQEAVTKAERLELLTKYPTLLAAQTKAEDGTVSNPMLDLLLSSNLPADQLKAKAEQLAASLPRQTAQPTGLPPMPTPAPTGNESAEELQAKAMEAHDRWIASGQTDAAAKAESDKYWGLHREAKKKKS